MVDLFYEYTLYSYGIPIAMYLVICLLLWAIGYRARWYIVESIIGLSWVLKDKDKKKSNEKKIQKFFYVQEDDENGRKSFPENMHWGMKLLCFFYTSAILGVFLAIIFQKCVLSFVQIRIDQRCPFDADCFYKRRGPYKCNKDQTANLLNIYNGTLSCFGWIIRDQDAETFIDAIGITGGLLGIISSIVPIIYFISTQTLSNGCSLRCSQVFVIFMVILALFPAGMLIFVPIYTKPIAPSMTTIFTLGILLLMTSTAWIWAVYAVFQCKWGSLLCESCDEGRIPFCCCPNKCHQCFV